MKRTYILLFALILSAALAADEPKVEKAESVMPTDIIRRSDDLLRGGGSYSKMTMTIVRPRWQRSVTLEGWTQGTSNAFMRILSPRKEKGVTFLKRGREAWQYVPAIDRTVKLPPSMMLQSWMGSDFTNDDVVRADSVVTDYDHSIVEEPEEAGVSYWVIESIPKPDAPVIWGRIKFKVRKSNYVADRVEFYDEDDELVRYYKAENIKKVEHLEVAMKLTAYDVMEPGNSTVIEYSELTFKPEFKKDTFSVRNLRK